MEVNDRAILDGWTWLAWDNPECREGLVGKGRRTTRGQLQTRAKKCFDHDFSFATLQKFCNIWCCYNNRLRQQIFHMDKRLVRKLRWQKQCGQEQRRWQRTRNSSSRCLSSVCWQQAVLQKKVQSGKCAANATFWNKQCQEPRPGNACQPRPVSIQLQLRDVALSAIAVQVCCGAAGVSNTLRPFGGHSIPWYIPAIILFCRQRPT